ncbi:MAG: hypothetical protein JXR25_16585 [Pontiellaceae bacterium]|nr:hypothetical protein [Pontiellaceae bacterium]MBN2786439.1 hypothetical protein [Pontiellaceae bacterium]
MIEQYNKSSGHSDREPPKRRGGCRDHHQLNQWQIRQYKQAIEENKWYMGQRLGRAIAWEEAEDDFLHNGYYGCAPKWRKEYCSNRCNHFSECHLGKLFIEQ